MSYSANNYPEYSYIPKKALSYNTHVSLKFQTNPNRIRNKTYTVFSVIVIKTRICIPITNNVIKMAALISLTAGIISDFNRSAWDNKCVLKYYGRTSMDADLLRHERLEFH